MSRETKSKAKSKISSKDKKGRITMDFMYSVFGLEDNYLDDSNPQKIGFFKRIGMKIRSIAITLMTFINSLPL